MKAFVAFQDNSAIGATRDNAIAKGKAKAKAKKQRDKSAMKTHCALVVCLNLFA